MRTPQQPPENPQRGALEPHVRMDALRLWLAGGIHKFAVDPRRRHGGHGRARQVLTEDRRTLPPEAAAWESLASTLDRHTVLGGMTELSPEERRVITLAYLEGRTNREIAAAQGVSVSTVKRHLQGALKQLDAYLARTGSWLLAILLLGTGWLVAAANKLGRSADTTRLTSMTAVGAVAAVAIGVAGLSPDSIRPLRPPAPATIQVRAMPPSAGVDAAATESPGQQSEPVATLVTFMVVADRSQHARTGPESEAPEATDPDRKNHGCGGKPTNAPPAVPVGPRGHGPHRPPVSHPGRGGCRA